MKKALLLIVLLIVVVVVSARLPQRPGKHGPKKVNGCQLQNCKKCHSKPFSCDECDHGFLREKVPLGYACRESCSPGLISVQGTCVEKQGCPTNCKTCQNRFSCSVCENGHVLYKGYLGKDMGRCIKKCPNGFKSKLNPMGGNKCAKFCTANCEKCQGRSCSVCEHGHALYKKLHQRGRPVCVKKCPTGFKAKVNPAGGNQCVRHCTANCKLCQGGSCSVCEHGRALYKGLRGRGRGVCIKKCPLDYKAKQNPKGGNECVKYCTANCKTCQGNFCSVCEQEHVLHKSLGGRGKGRCLRKCPKGFKTGVNPSGGNKCVRSCAVANCESCPRGGPQQPYKCARCESGFYRLSVGKSWPEQYDFCFSHCPAGYSPKNVKGVAQCQKESESKNKATSEPITMPEFTATTEPEPTPSEEPTSEPETTPDPKTEAESTPSGEPTSEPVTEPDREPTTISTDFWP